jgi:opine dehydrogenase
VENGPRDFAPVELATTDARAALDGADVIALCTGGNAQEGAARDLAPLLVDGQILLLVQGNTGGSLVVRRALVQAGCRARVDIAEVDTYPYITPRPAPARARIHGRKRWLQIAAFPGDRGPAVMERLGPLFPEAVLAPSIAATGLTNMNGTLHVANCVANAGRIQAGQTFRFYAEGVTPAVARLYEALDMERQTLGAKLGVEVPTVAEWIGRAFGVREPSLVETFQRLTFDADGPYRNTPTPATLDHNYIVEDVPTGLMAMSALGTGAGVPTPVIDALITLSRTMTGRDFATEGRTLDRLGLAGRDAAGIREVLEHGWDAG